MSRKGQGKFTEANSKKLVAMIKDNFETALQLLDGASQGAQQISVMSDDIHDIQTLQDIYEQSNLARAHAQMSFDAIDKITFRYLNADSNVSCTRR